MKQIIEISIDQLEFWGENPRFGLNSSHDTDRKAIQALFNWNEEKMVKLAKDIAEFGLVANDLPIVFPLPNGRYRVFEGNRRVACLFVLNDHEYLNFDAKLKKRFDQIKYDDKIKSLNCLVSDDKTYIYNAVKRIHGGENNGIGRISWGTTEDNAFKDLLNNLPKDASSVVVETLSPHYILLKSYPHKFTKIVEDMNPTNVDRILSKTSIKDVLEIKSYEELPASKTRAIELILNHAYISAKDFPGGISRKYNDEQIKEELVPLLKEKIHELNETISATPSLIYTTKEIILQEGETRKLSDFIKNASEFETIKYNTKSDLIINPHSTITSDNNPGKYFVTASGFFDGIEVTSTVFNITITKRKLVITKKDNSLLKHDFLNQYVIDISNPVNELIKQINSLSLAKHYYVIISSLRVLVEHTTGLFVKHFGCILDKSLNSTLEKNLDAFKKYFVNSNITKLDDTSKIGYKSLSDFFTKLDPKVLSKNLHPLAHNLSTPDKSYVENLGIQIANILVVISISIRSLSK